MVTLFFFISRVCTIIDLYVLPCDWWIWENGKVAGNEGVWKVSVILRCHRDDSPEKKHSFTN